MNQENLLFNEIVHLKGHFPIEYINKVYIKLQSNINKSNITVIIPSGGRYEQLKKCIESLKNSEKYSKYRITYLVVESSEYMESKEFCKSNNISYVWFYKPPGIRYNKCLAHNIGYCLTKAKLLLFHDCDLVVNKTFFNNFRKYNLNEESVAHCIGNQYVNYIHQNITEDYINNLISLDDVIKNPNNYFTPSPEAWLATGGSIIVGRKLFKDIGGFDSHLFSGYSVEDKFFWDKILTIKPIPSINENNIFHLFHESGRHIIKDDEDHLRNFHKLEKDKKYIYFELCKKYLVTLNDKIKTIKKK